MALGHSPLITTNGMILCYDAANIKSYPGSGSTLTDLSTTINTATLFNTPTFSTNNNGTLVYDGVDDYAQATTNPNITSAASFEVVVNTELGSPYASNWMFGIEGCYRFTYTSSTIQWVCATVNNSWYAVGTYVGANVTPVGSWKHFVVTYTGTRLQIYTNGILTSTSTSDISGNILTGGNPFQIGKSLAGNVSYGKGNIPLLRCYNRLLTDVEIQANFNAVRGRYGI